MEDSVPLCMGKTVLMTRDHLEYDCFLRGPLELILPATVLLFHNLQLVLMQMLQFIIKMEMPLSQSLPSS